MLHKSQLRVFPKKLQSRWTGLYHVTQVFLYGTVEIQCGMNG